jgi:hypothetical protein
VGSNLAARLTGVCALSGIIDPPADHARRCLVVVASAIMLSTKTTSMIVSDSAHAGVRRAPQEVAVAACLVAAVCAVNFVTAELYPLAWLDECMYVDPAVNLLRHNGFTSSAWYDVVFGRFWFSNTPLYEALLFVWGKLFGDGFTALRSLNDVLISIAAMLLYWFASRSGELRSFRSRLGFVLVSLLGYGITYSYRSARPDAICAALSALLLLVSTLSDPRLRRSAVIAVAALFPWAGLQLVVATALMSGLIALCTGRRYLRTLLWVAAGVAAGGCLMLCFYAVTGHLMDFIISTVGSQHSLVGQLGQYVVYDDQRGIGRFALLRILHAVIEDPSSAVGLVTAGMLLASARVRRSPEAVHRLAASIGVGLLIPWGLFFAGKYPLYYTWIGLLPIWFLILAALDRISPLARLERSLAFGLLIVSLPIGWPFLVGSAVLAGSARDYTQVRRFVGQLVKPGEWTCISPSAYFAVVESGGVPFLCAQYATSRLAPNIPPEQRRRLSIILADPRTAAEIIDRLPGPWTETASMKVAQKRPPWLSWLYNDSDSYDLVAYWRAH